MADTRSKAEKMRAVANAKSAAPAERAFAKTWLAEHNEPLTKSTPPFDPLQFTRYHTNTPRDTTRGFTETDFRARRDAAAAEAAANRRSTMSDQEKRRADAREEAAYQRAQRKRYAEETGRTINADAFEDAFRQSFYEGFAEEMGTSPFFRARPVDSPFRGEEKYRQATAETEAARREEARLAREHADAMTRAQRNVREESRAYAQDALHQIRMERDRRSAERAAAVDALKGKTTPSIDRDAAGNPIYRRRG